MRRIAICLGLWGAAGCASGQSLPVEPGDAAGHGAPALSEGLDQPGADGPVSIETQFATPDRVAGVDGGAWRTDGFSSFARARLDLGDADALTASTWIALESYPSDLEVPVRRLTPSSIMNQREGRSGFDLFIDTSGRWWLWAGTSRGTVSVMAPEPPLQDADALGPSGERRPRHLAADEGRAAP